MEKEKRTRAGGAGYLCRMTLVATRTAGVCGRRRWADGSDESWRRQGPHTARGHHSLCSELPVGLNQRNSNQTEGLQGYHRQLCLCSFQLWTCGERDQHLKTMLSDAYSASVYFALGLPISCPLRELRSKAKETSRINKRVTIKFPRWLSTGEGSNVNIFPW